MDRQRLKYVDVAKGITMIMVIAGHCKYVPIALKIWIYSFHMPVFFALSGYTFRSEKYETIKDLIVSKVRTLLIPYLGLSVILWILRWCVFFRFTLYEEMAGELIGILVGWRLTKYYFTMWFIPVLFFAEIIVYAVHKYCEQYVLGIGLVSYIIGVITSSIVKGLPLSIDLIPFGVAFILFGAGCRKCFCRSEKAMFSENCILIIAWSINIAFCSINYFLTSLMTDLYYSHSKYLQLYQYMV